jgi:hypothetical protein
MARRIMFTLSTLICFGTATCVATLVSYLALAQPVAETSEHLRPPSAFSGISDRAARMAKALEEQQRQPDIAALPFEER